MTTTHSPATPRPSTARVDPRVARSRAAVLAAALELLLERGIAGTTIEAVAERSGVARTTIYRHWSRQAELVVDAIGSTLVVPAPPNTGNLRGDLCDLVGGLAQALVDNPVADLMFALVEAAGRDPAFADLHAREAEQRHSVVLDAIRLGIERGELPPGTDPAEVVDLVAGPVFYRRMMSQQPLDRGFAERVVDQVLAGYTRAGATGLP